MLGAPGRLLRKNASRTLYSTARTGSAATATPSVTFSGVSSALGECSGTSTATAVQRGISAALYGELVVSAVVANRFWASANQAVGEISAVSDELCSASHGSATFTYNVDGQLIRVLYQDGHFINYTYDVDGLLETTTAGDGVTKDFTYDANDQLIQITVG